MTANPALGVALHWIGGLAGASFYLPYLRVRRWAWETYWFTGGLFSWIIAPLVLAWLLVPNLWHVIGSAPARVLFLAYLFGALWGVGGITYGLAIRYLGIGLGIAVALGYCAAFGSLIPPLVQGQFHTLLFSRSGEVVLLGVLVCLAGVITAGIAGMLKEREVSAEQKKATTAEFSFGKGFLIATFAGIMSAAFALGLNWGQPIATLAKAQLITAGDNLYWQGLPVLVVVLWGGFTTNFIWCLILSIKNHSGKDYFSPWQSRPVSVIDTAADPAAPTSADRLAPDTDSALTVATVQTGREVRIRVPLLNNYAFSALAGTIWYLQLFFYTMGQTKLGKYQFSGWTLHMASLIIFATLWGILLKEWRGASGRSHFWIGMGLLLLVGSTIIIGYGNYLGTTVAAGVTRQ